MPPRPDHHIIQAAASILLERRRSGTPGARLPPSCRPPDLACALAIQEAVSAQINDAIAGWKCGLPAADKWVLAPIYGNTVHRSSDGTTCAVGARHASVRIEPELAFVLAHDLPPRATPYAPGEIDAAIAGAHLALELIGTRYREPEQASFAEHLADGLFNQGLYLGPAVELASARRCAALQISLTVENQAARLLDGRHPNGNPLAPLYWLAEFLRSRGQGLRAGQAVITGSYAGSLDVPLQAAIGLQFGELGRLSVRFR